MLTVVKMLGIWACFIPIAIANGVLREKCLNPLVGKAVALPLSGITASLLFFLLAYLALPWLGVLKAQEYWLVGLGWLAMTVGFEFLFGRVIARKGWGELLRSYDVTTGNLWLLVLLVICVSPYLVGRLRGLTG